MDSWMIFQLTLLEVMTLGWQATRRCILCTLATRLFHHPLILTKILLKMITRPAQLVLINLLVAVANRAFQNAVAKSCWVAVPRVSEATFSALETTRPAVTTVAILRTWITRLIIQIPWIIYSDPCRPCTTSTTRWIVLLSWDIRRTDCIIRIRRSIAQLRVPSLVRFRSSKLRIPVGLESSPITFASTVWDRFTPIQDWMLINLKQRASTTCRRLKRNETADLCPCTRIIFERDLWNETWSFVPSRLEIRWNIFWTRLAEKIVRGNSWKLSLQRELICVNFCIATHGITYARGNVTIPTFAK